MLEARTKSWATPHPPLDHACLESAVSLAITTTKMNATDAFRSLSSGIRFNKKKDSRKSTTAQLVGFAKLQVIGLSFYKLTVMNCRIIQWPAPAKQYIVSRIWEAGTLLRLPNERVRLSRKQHILVMANALPQN